MTLQQKAAALMDAIYIERETNASSTREEAYRIADAVFTALSAPSAHAAELAKTEKWDLAARLIRSLVDDDGSVHLERLS